MDEERAEAAENPESNPNTDAEQPKQSAVPMTPLPKAAPADQPKRSGCAGKGCLIASLAALVILAVSGIALVFIIGLLGIISEKISEFENTESSAFQYTSARNFKEIYVEGYDSVQTKNKIALINVNGVIVSEDSGSYYDTAVSSYIRAQLRKAANDPAVKAVIINLNTPGGEVTASDEIYEEILRVRKHKPVVAMMNSIAASGGYYIAAGCRPIISNKLTLTGSIGVIIATYNYHKLFEKIGLQSEVYTSGPMKDMLNGGRARTPQEIAVIQTLVNNTYDVFVNIVAKSRGISPEKIRSSVIGDGRVFDGKQALQLGLVDKLGYFQDAVAAAVGQAKIEGSYTVIQYEEAFSFSKLFHLLSAKAQPVNISIQGESASAFRPQQGRLYYLPPSF